MTEPRFFPRPEPLGLDRIRALTGASAVGPGAKGLAIDGVAPLGRAGPNDLALYDAEAVRRLGGRPVLAGAVLVAPGAADALGAGVVALVAADPAAAYAAVATALFPAAARARPLFGPGVSPGATVHPGARLEPDVAVDPGAVIGPGVEIGSGAAICANAVIGPDVRIGRGAFVGAGASVFHALVGDRVMIGQGARIGCEAGVAAGARGPGRAILQDGVEIGANAVVDRGTDRDTVIGEASRIDNLVQIGHNVVIGRRCVLFSGARVGSGAVLDDFTVLHGAGTTQT